MEYSKDIKSVVVPEGVKELEGSPFQPPFAEPASRTTRPAPPTLVVGSSLIFKSDPSRAVEPPLIQKTTSSPVVKPTLTLTVAPRVSGCQWAALLLIVLIVGALFYFAFRNEIRFAYNSSIVIPEGVEVIEKEAYRGCRDLESIEIPEGVEEIGDGSFSDCSNLRNVKLPTTLKKIVGNAFEGSPFQLDEQSLPPGVIVLSAGYRMVLTVDGIDYAFRWCPPGEFMMGSPESEPDRDSDEKQHRVTLTQGFWLLETEVTQEMWESVMGATIDEQREKADYNKLYGVGAKNPMYFVSWHESVEFCEKLSRKLNREIKLPTEAQWEYACRAGSTEAYAGTGDLDDMGWYDGNSDSKTHEVGLKRPNAWGLYDMHGNVWEWCSDYYDGDYYAESPTSDPENRTPSPNRVFRGGSWVSLAGHCRSANRFRLEPDYRYDVLGLRVLLVPSSRD